MQLIIGLPEAVVLSMADGYHRASGKPASARNIRFGMDIARYGVGAESTRHQEVKPEEHRARRV